MSTVLVAVLFAVGYTVSIAVLTRWLLVVRERRLRWFLAHQLAVAAIVVGWTVRELWTAVVVNAAWLVVAAVWYAMAGDRRARGGGDGS